MSEPFLSASWFRVANLRPALRSDVEVSRHRYRKRAWYVLRDPIGGHTHRVSPIAYQLVGRMDGSSTVSEILDEVSEHVGSDAPSQSDVVRLITQLNGADLLRTDAVPDAGEVVDRQARRMRAKVIGYVKSPLSVRVPLFNPDRLLERTIRLFQPFFGMVGLLLWLSLVCSAGVLASVYWQELSGNIQDRILAYSNIPILVVAYLSVKLLHELGHAYAVKAFGGEVREVGVMLLVLFPVPYVDASASTHLRSKWKRMTVAAAGILVELALASLAMLAWIVAEPGLFRAFLFNVMVIGGVSTLVFNGNPLLRFDGYYVLSDWLEIPNLAQRSNKYIGYLSERYLFNLRSAAKSVAGWGERIAFLIYAPTSFVYRMLVMASLALVIGSKFFFVGILLAVWAVTTGLIMPMFQLLLAVVNGPKLRRRRIRAVSLTLAATAAALAFIIAVPVPSHTTTEGVVWLPQGSSIAARTDGFIEDILAKAGQPVRAGEPLVSISDPQWAAEKRSIDGKIEELQAQYVAARFDDRAKAQSIALERENETASLQRQISRAESGLLVSPADGVFVFPAVEDSKGRFVKEGTVLAYVTPAANRTLRILVAQNDIGLVRNRIGGIEVKLLDQPDRVYKARIVREVPAAASDLPSKAFGTGGGGQFVTDPRDPNGRKAFQRLFQFDIELLDTPEHINFGSRALVRFNLQWEPLGSQLYRRAQQLFLGRFDV